MKPMIVRTVAAAAGTAALIAMAAASPALAAPASPARQARPAGAAPSVPVTYPGHPIIPATGSQAKALALGRYQPAVESGNWAGYAATRRTFRAVQATFFVPYLNCGIGAASGSRYSSHWVGLDGFSDHSVEQDGIEADCFGAKAVYHAWYEFFPKPETRIGLRVAAGQSVTASVSYNRSSQKFTLALADNTTRRHFRISLRCRVRCLRSSAEVISEAPTLVNGKGQLRLASLADYGAAGYSGVSVTTAGGIRAGMYARDWSTTKIIQVSQQGSHPVVARPTTVHDHGFSVYWLRQS